jgi:cell division septation protein DedD
MSTRDSGLGGKAGRPSEFESDFANRQNTGNAPGGQSWSANAHNKQKSEVPFMVQGAGRPGQPIIGQRSIFGGGSPVFAQMPSYTPVTRGSEPPPQTPQPQPAYTPYTPNQPAAPVQPRPQQQAPRQPSPQAPAAPSYQPQAQPQAFPASSYNGAQALPSQGYAETDLPDLSNADPGFPESIFPDFNASDASFPETSFSDQTTGDAGFSSQSDVGFSNQGYADVSFPEQGADASFPETNFAASPDFGHNDALSGGEDAGYGAAPAGGDHRYDMLNGEGPQDFGVHQPQMQPLQPQAQPYQPHMPQSQVPPSDPRRQLQAFDALYDQPPQIALGATQHPPQAPQNFYEADRADADFMDESQVLPPPGKRSKMAMSLRGRSAFMVGSALLGAIALGGALAYAYKQSGGSMSSGQPPIVQADNRPVKEAPDEPGGKQFAHNKLIYDRLTNGDSGETDKLVPRQEDVAVPALPPSTDTAGLPAPVASTDLGTPPTTQAVDGAPADDGGPRKVKTLVVRPDGSVETPPATEAAAGAASQDAAPAAMPVPQAAAPAPAPAPAPKVAAVQPKPKPAPAPQAASKYVVQVGSKRNQTDALATFADIQQKYPKLLANYRPIVQKADLGSKGTWYRLRIGPIDDKSEAYKLCGQLKSQGLPDCLVMTQ